MESSEIDLSEFQEENRDDGGAENNGAGQDEAHPSSAAPEAAPVNPGGTISLVLLLIHFLIRGLLNNLKNVNRPLIVQKVEQSLQIDKERSL